MRLNVAFMVLKNVPLFAFFRSSPVGIVSRRVAPGDGRLMCVMCAHKVGVCVCIGLNCVKIGIFGSEGEGNPVREDF